MKKWKFTVKASDDNVGFKLEMYFDDLKEALKCAASFVNMDCSLVQLIDEKGVLIQYA